MRIQVRETVGWEMPYMSAAGAWDIWDITDSPPRTTPLHLRLRQQHDERACETEHPQVIPAVPMPRFVASPWSAAAWA